MSKPLIPLASSMDGNDSAATRLRALGEASRAYAERSPSKLVGDCNRDKSDLSFLQSADRWTPQLVRFVSFLPAFRSSA
jgi:hypothetical protein